MKIVALVHFYIEENRAGGELMMAGLLESLVKSGHDVTCLVTDTLRHNSVVNGVKVIYGASAKMLHTYPSDAVITHFQNGLATLAYCNQTATPIIYVTHNDMPPTLQIMRQIKNGMIVFNTEWIKKKAYFTVDSTVVHPPVHRPKTPQNDPEGYITLVNLTQPKGSGIFYELARLNPDRKFLGVKGGYWKDRQLVKDLPNVDIIEMTDDMQNEVYAKSRIILMPSTYESFGMVAAEAMANKIPVVVSSTKGLEENVGEAGLYADFRAIEGWNEAIALLDDPKEYKVYQEKVYQQSKKINQQDELNEFVKKVEALHAI